MRLCLLPVECFVAADLDLSSHLFSSRVAFTMVTEHKKKWQRMSHPMRDYWSSGEEARGVSFKEFLEGHLTDANANRKRVKKKYSTYGWQKEWFYGSEFYWHPDAEPDAWYRKVPVSGSKSGFVYIRMTDHDWDLEQDFFYLKKCAVQPFSVLPSGNPVRMWYHWQ